MNTKTKILISALILAAFVVGGLSFNAFRAEALKGAGSFFHKSDMNKEDWAAYKEDWAALKEEWKDMSTEEQKAKKEAMKGLKSGHSFWMFKKFGDEINHEIITLDDGIQITITSGNPDIVQKFRSLVEKFNK